jgi:tetratricopeptide (TPR) repeat protein
MRIVIAGAIAAALASRAGGEMPRRDPAGDAITHARLVQQYQRGETDDAIRALVSWTPRALLDVVSRAEKGRPTTAMAIVRRALPAAVMLHTECGLYLNLRGDVGPAGLHWLLARRLAALPPATPEQGAFLRAWYHAFGLFLLSTYAVDDAIVLLEHGLRQFPDDVPIALALGQYYEARGTFTPGHLVSVQATPSRDGLRDLRSAEALFRALLAEDPSRTEAKLHLARVLQVMGRLDEALPLFHEVAAAGESRQRYLAFLFVGELARRRSRLAEARDDFTRAREAWPTGQAAAVALAETLHRLGERAAAASALTEAIEDRGRPSPPDPFRTYHFGDRTEQKRLLEAVKSLALR